MSQGLPLFDRVNFDGLKMAVQKDCDNLKITATDGLKIWSAGLSAFLVRQKPEIEGPVAEGRTRTSKEAANKIKPKVGSIRARVFALFFDKGPMTGETVYLTLGTKETSTRPRVTELANEGKIEDSGECELNQYGNNEIIWRIPICPQIQKP